MSSSPLKLGLIVLGCLALMGCAEQKPSNGIVEVGDDVITQLDLDQWISLVTVLNPAASNRLRPPRFTACVAAVREASGSSSLPLTMGRQQCRERLEAVLGALIERHWLEQEARRLDIRLEERAVREAVKAEYQRSLYGTSEGRKRPDAATRHLRSTLLQLLMRQGRIDQLKRKVRDRLKAADGLISDQDVERFYDRHAQRFVIPASRRVRVLRVPTGVRAQLVARALRTGRGWKRFARRILFSSVPTSPNGRVAVAENSGDEVLLRAVFSTPVGQVGGPVSDGLGRYVFIVDRATPRSHHSSTRARRTIRRLLVWQRDVRIRRRYVARYRSKTVCGADYVNVHCANSSEAQR